jgi:hypothetical protein
MPVCLCGQELRGSMCGAATKLLFLYTSPHCLSISKSPFDSYVYMQSNKNASSAKTFAKAAAYCKTETELKSTRNAATGSVPAGDPRGYARQPATPISPVICPRSSRPSRHVGCWPWALARSEKGEEIFPIISTSQMAGLGAGKTTRTEKLPWPGPS